MEGGAAAVSRRRPGHWVKGPRVGTLRDTLIKKQESYARGQYLNRKVLEPFLEACDDTLPNQNSAHHDLINSSNISPHSVFTTCDDQGRPHRVWRRDCRSRSNTLLLEERRRDCSLNIAETRDGLYITVNSNSHTSSEVHLLSCSCPEDGLVLVKNHQPGSHCHVEHAHGKFYILFCEGHSDYQLLVSYDYDPSSWEPHPLMAKLEDLTIQDLEVCAKFLVLYCTKDTQPVAVVIDAVHQHGPHFINCPEDLCWLEKPPAPVRFDADLFPMSFSSPSCLPCTFLTDGSSHWLEEGGVTRDGAAAECSITRTLAPANMDDDVAGDEKKTEIPVTLCYHGDSPTKNSPLLLNVYGCYGECLYMGYRPLHKLLLSLGWTLAFCHVRGGGEKGRGWHHAGQGTKKMNSIKDVAACTRHLHHTLHVSQPALTAIAGRSAGGQVAAMFAHLWPDRLQAALLQVPFLNVVKALSGSSRYYIDGMDQGEYGGLSSHEDEALLRSVCPFSSLKPQDYPSFFIAASRDDSLVSFGDVRQYASNLTRCVKLWSQQQTNTQQESPTAHALLPRGTVVFHTLTGQGHFVSEDLETRAETDALQVLFLHQALGLSLSDKLLNFVN